MILDTFGRFIGFQSSWHFMFISRNDIPRHFAHIKIVHMDVPETLKIITLQWPSILAIA
jgi:hypothetical protein